MSHPLVVNRHHTDDYDVYVGRPTEWGNPYSHRRTDNAMHTVFSREVAIEEYRSWLKRRINNEPDMMRKLAALHGKRLACWCAPKPCHADVLAKAATWAWKIQQGQDSLHEPR